MSKHYVEALWDATATPILLNHFYVDVLARSRHQTISNHHVNFSATAENDDSHHFFLHNMHSALQPLNKHSVRYVCRYLCHWRVVFSCRYGLMSHWTQSTGEVLRKYIFRDFCCFLFPCQHETYTQASRLCQQIQTYQFDIETSTFRSWWCHCMESLFACLAPCEGNIELSYFLCRLLNKPFNCQWFEKSRRHGITVMFESKLWGSTTLVRLFYM